MTETGQPGRLVVGNITLSLDGRITGPGGEYDMSWIVPHAVTDQSRAHLARLMETATTGLLGRKNYQGFSSYWPAVADDEGADPRDRAFSRWLNQVQKVVFSRTLTESEWANTTLTASDPAAVVRELRGQPGGDILVLSSTSIIQHLLEAGELDRLCVVLCPELVGAGARFFGDGPAGSSWSLAEATPTDSGAVILTYDRKRPA